HFLTVLLSTIPPPPAPPLFPYTTLFRSGPSIGRLGRAGARREIARSGAARHVHVAGAVHGHAGAEFIAAAAEQRGEHQRRINHRSEEHTSELQSRSDLVCRLLLEKKKNN